MLRFLPDSSHSSLRSFVSHRNPYSCFRANDFKQPFVLTLSAFAAGSSTKPPWRRKLPLLWKAWTKEASKLSCRTWTPTIKWIASSITLTWMVTMRPIRSSQDSGAFLHIDRIWPEESRSSVKIVVRRSAGLSSPIPSVPLSKRRIGLWTSGEFAGVPLCSDQKFSRIGREFWNVRSAVGFRCVWRCLAWSEFARYAPCIMTALQEAVRMVIMLPWKVELFR